MTHCRGSLVICCAVVVTAALVWHALAGQGETIMVYEGQIKGIRIDKCGLQPGLCEGSIIIAAQEGGDTILNLRVGTWIKRGDYFLTIEDLKIGDRVRAQAFRFPGDASARAAIIEFAGP